MIRVFPPLKRISDSSVRSQEAPAIRSTREMLTAARLQFRQPPFLLGHDSTFGSAGHEFTS
jgi:hypothetical protein